MGKKAEKIIQYDNVYVRVYEYPVSSKGYKDYTIPTVSIHKTYLDKNKQVRQSSCFGVNDIPKLRLALNEAYKFILNSNTGNGDFLSGK